MTSRILILDFGSQFTQLIARRVREMSVYCEIHPYDHPNDAIRGFDPDGVILSGGPNSVIDTGSPRIPDAVLELGIPILGICYGMQALASQLDGKVENCEKREFGHADVSYQATHPLFKRVPPHHHKMPVWMSHGDQVTQMPTGFNSMAKTDTCPVAAMAHEKKHYYGIQFHPEVTHTTFGKYLLEAFVLDICGCQPDWTMQDFLTRALTYIQNQVGRDHVILGLSGGVDSSVAAALIHKAIGKQLTCVFVDHGLLRLNEGQEVETTFAKHIGLKLISIDASTRFMNALKGEADPEKKRKIIGTEFVRVFEEEARKIEGAKWLAQGTIYPDVIESAGAKKASHTIKSHHNVGGLPADLGLKLLEPLRELFKDEVRALGLELGLPADLVFRHPFPGPGLGVRILGEVSKEPADLLRRADHIFIEELKNTIDPTTGKTWYQQTSQAFAVFLPVRSVGVMGDGRTYENVVALRAVQTTDFMTATWAYLPHDLLAKVSNRIINEVRGINRVTYDISSKPPATIEWE
jgi:GMP synthase (glutamine-hydrolysing)